MCYSDCSSSVELGVLDSRNLCPRVFKGDTGVVGGISKGGSVRVWLDG